MIRRGALTAGACCSSSPVRSSSSSFTLPSPPTAPEARPVSAPLAPAGIEALLAMQGVEDATERRKRSVVRGRNALDVLDEALDALLHEGGYRGKSRELLQMYAFGVYPGLRGLCENGMTAAPGFTPDCGENRYPRMLHWLRD